MYKYVHIKGQTCNMQVHVEIRGQLVGVNSPFHHVFPGDQTQKMRIGGKCFYLLSFHVSSEDVH